MTEFEYYREAMRSMAIGHRVFCAEAGYYIIIKTDELNSHFDLGHMNGERVLMRFDEEENLVELMEQE